MQSYDHYKDMDKDVLQQQINMLIAEEKSSTKLIEIKTLAR